ncbi:MBL fold metallo-hydrolase, partial [candidate division KSB1 bacterium]
MKKWILFGILAGIAVIVVLFGRKSIYTRDLTLAHHTAKGFRNPYPSYTNYRPGDFFKWTIVERIRGVKPEKPDTYSFETVENDGAFLRENSSEFTVTWIGHSTLLIQMDGKNILTDPVWSDYSSPLQFVGPKRYVPPGIRFEDLPEIDYVVISHDHYDHLDKNTVKRLGDTPEYFVPLGVGNFLKKQGIMRIHELDWWE